MKCMPVMEFCSTTKARGEVSLSPSSQTCCLSYACFVLMNMHACMNIDIIGFLVF